MKKLNKCIVYISTKELETYEEKTLDQQMTECLEFCDEHNLDTVEIFADKAIEDRLSNRLGIQHLFAYLYEHPEIEHIVALNQGVWAKSYFELMLIGSLLANTSTDIIYVNPIPLIAQQNMFSDFFAKVRRSDNKAIKEIEDFYTTQKGEL